MFSAGKRSRGAAPHRLLERDWELAAIDRVLAGAHDGAGAVALIEGEAGSGKSRLLDASVDLAALAGLQVLSARGAELEQEFPFGLAIQLFEPVWLASDAEQRSALLDGPARRVSGLFDASFADEASAPQRSDYPIIHGLFWMARQLGRPLAIVVDDAHWSDVPSLRFLAYLAERVRQLPVAILLSARQGESGSEPKALASLRRAAQGNLLRLKPLSREAATTIVRRQFPAADAVFCEACARISGGNPFLLVELLSKLREEEKSTHATTMEELASVLPEKVTGVMAARLDGMLPPARALASAVAVLDGAKSVAQAAAVAEIDVSDATRAADELAALGLLRSGVPLSFAHRLLREAVLAASSPLERAHLHARAASVLAAEGANAEQIAAHLIEAPPGYDQTAAATLREAAAIALGSRQPDRAAALLERALAEHPSGELRTDLVLVRSDLLCEQGRFAEAAALLHAELAPDLQDERGASELDAAYVFAASLAPGGHSASRPVRERMIEALPASPSRRQRRALAHSLVYESLLGAPRTEVLRLAELAWGDGTLLAENPNDGLAWPLLCAALWFVDELEHVLALSEGLLRAPAPPAGRPPAAVVRACRAWALAEQGQLAQAAADASVSLAQATGPGAQLTGVALATLAICHVERGELEQADAALAQLADSSLPEPIRQPLVLELRARLRLAQRRPAEALTDVTSAAEALRSQFGAVSPAALPWRSTAALAYLALGQTDEARLLAAEELIEARRVGATRVVIRDLRVLGLATSRTGGIELLAQAVELGAASPPRLEYVHALVDLGAALRRGNRRADARDPLRRGLELAGRGDALALVRRARTELLATTSRRDLPTLSGPESLTPSQHRVADLAAQGLTTRQISEALFVTHKTVEFHLRQIYRKLDVSSREELAGVLRAEASDEVPGEDR